MPEELRDFPHLKFRRCWTISAETSFQLGRCAAIADSLAQLPVSPENQEQLKQVAFQRGAQATTAIEGNTITDEELRKLVERVPLPKSREYQAREVQNALDAMQMVWSRVVEGDGGEKLNARFIKECNRIIGKDLGALYDGVPGRLRADRRHVGRYLAPPPEKVPQLVEEYCDWLRREFPKRDTGDMSSVIVEAIVAHVFFEWIHPFADGNGRTGRLLEFYLLLQGGMPDIAAHVLANHYNLTRTEYAAHFEEARRQRDLTAFLNYSIQGLLDGLLETEATVRHMLFELTWKSLIYDRFAAYTDYHKRSIFRRRRALALAMPIGGEFSVNELLVQSASKLGDHLQEYLGKDFRTLIADLKKIAELGLVRVEGRNRYVANTQLLKSHFARRRSDNARQQDN